MSYPSDKFGKGILETSSDNAIDVIIKNKKTSTTGAAKYPTDIKQSTKEKKVPTFLEIIDDETRPFGFIKVAKSGGDYQNIQEALDYAKTLANETTPIVVAVYPGIYTELATNGQNGQIRIFNNTILSGVVTGSVVVDANITIEVDGQVYNIVLKAGKNFIQLEV